MSLIENISKNEKELMEKYIDNYASEQYGIRSASIDYLLRFWDREKEKYLFKLLGNQLMVTKEITFKQDIEETAEEVSRAIMANSNASKFMNEWRQNFGWIFGGSIVQHIPSDVRRSLYDMCSTGYLARNTWIGDTFIVPFPDGTNFKVQRGAKITKAMGKIAKAFDMDMDLFESFRIACSQGLNQKKLHGNLTLSIHPMDYMTMSDNNCDWSSCMSWKEHGCYRQGTVEMMNSPMVIVAYLTAENNDLIIDSDHTWNSKKWRELMIITPDIICNVLGYPYRNNYLSAAALEWIKELAETNLGWSYKNSEPVVWQQATWFKPFEDSDTEITVYPETGYMYNDFSDRDHYGYFSPSVAETLYVYYSGTSECMSCGAADPDIEEEGYLVGNCCEPTSYCDCCGERMDPNEGIWVDDQFICSYCYDEYVNTDVYGDPHLNQNLKEIVLMGPNNQARYDIIYICDSDWCWDEISKYCTRLYKYQVRAWHDPKYYVSINDLTEEGIRAYANSMGCDDSITALMSNFKTAYYRVAPAIDLDTCVELTPESGSLY